MTESALDRLSEILDSEVPDGLRILDEADLVKLADMIQDAIESQESEVERAEKDLIRHIPAPLRGPVKKILR